MALEWVSIPSLKGCGLKIEWADKHIENLSNEINAFLKGNPQSVVGKLDEQSGHYVLTATGKSDVDHFSIGAGAIIHQCRSSLDFLARRLVVKNCKTLLSKKTAFPIYLVDPAKSSDPNVLRDYKRKVKGMSFAAQTIIKRLQPYESLGDDNPLAIINEMDITDKHHEPLVVIPSVRIPTIRFSNQFMVGADFAPLDSTASEAIDGAEVARIIPLMGNMNVQVSTSFNIAFPKVGLRKNQAVIPTLKQLRDATVNIINEFRGEF